MSYPQTTNVEMILRLSDGDDQQAWNEFVGVYEPLILRTATKLGLNSNDAVDASQEVLVHLARVVSQWKPTGRRGSFRTWLVRVAKNEMLKLVQRTTMLNSEAGSENLQQHAISQAAIQADESNYFNIEFRRQVFLYVVQKIRKRFKEKTWQAFWQTYMDERSPEVVAVELELSLGAIYVARSRVMNRLQNEIKLLVDEEWMSLMSVDLKNDPSLTLSIIRHLTLDELDDQNRGDEKP